VLRKMNVAQNPEDVCEDLILCESLDGKAERLALFLRRVVDLCCCVANCGSDGGEASRDKKSKERQRTLLLATTR